MKSTRKWLFIPVLAAVAATGFYFWPKQPAPTPQAQMAPPPTEVPPAPVLMPAPAPASAPVTHYPVPASATTGTSAAPVPQLQASDATVAEALSALPAGKALMAFFYPGDIVRHLVVTIDNLPREVVATRLLPVKPVGSRFLVTGASDTLVIAPANAARYAAYVGIAEKMDTKQLVQLYFRFYPLFQQAYRELGYPNGEFNDRLVAVLGHLLVEHADSEPVRLVQPHVLYHYADPALQSRSAGQKILLRMGTENAARIRVKLREVRQILTAQKAEK